MGEVAGHGRGRPRRGARAGARLRETRLRRTPCHAGSARRREAGRRAFSGAAGSRPRPPPDRRPPRSRRAAEGSRGSHRHQAIGKPAPDRHLPYPRLREGGGKLLGAESPADGEQPVADAHGAPEGPGEDGPSEQEGQARAVQVVDHERSTGKIEQRTQHGRHLRGVDVVQEERGGHHVEGALGEGQGAHVAHHAVDARRGLPEVQRLDVQADRHYSRREGPQQEGGQVGGAAAHVEQPAAPAQVGADRSAQAASSAEPTVHAAQVTEATEGFLLGDPLVEELGIGGAAAQIREHGQQNSSRANSAQKPGPKAPSTPRSPGRGRCRRMISSSTKSTVTELMLPCSESTASVGTRPSSRRPSRSAITSMIRRPPGWSIQRGTSLLLRWRGPRNASTAPTTSRLTKGASPLSRMIWSPSFRSAKPIRWVVSGKKMLSASTRRARAGPFARGCFEPTSTTAAPPSPNIAVETTFVAERSQRWNVRLESSMARTRAARSGWAAR